MEHELLHDEPVFNARIANKGKKEKEKVDPGERKKWNFRKTNTMDVGPSNRSPSPTSGLVNPSAEMNTKGMIFENKISDTEYNIAEETELQAYSPPNVFNLPPPQRKRTTSPHSVSFDHQSTPNASRHRQQSLATSPPPINIPRSPRTPPERYYRQTSMPVIGSPVQPLSTNVNHSHSIETNESFTQTTPLQTDRPIQSNSPWESVQQPILITADKLSNVIDVSQEECHKKRTTEKETTGGEAMEESKNIMWKGNNQQELIQDKWTDFSSTTNEVFVPGDSAWAMADNAAVERDENERQSEGDSSNSSHSSSSSESAANEETEESVWKINEEQRAYYLNQFQVLQPAEKGVVTGPKARDFFLKSGLATDVLSKIWNLADLDSDGGLNFEEFCIAMHIVVAVRHGLEVPVALPQYLVPGHHEEQVVLPSQKTETENTEQLSVPEAPQSWARFSPDPNVDAASEEETTTVQPVPADPRHTSVETTMPDPRHTSVETTMPDPRHTSVETTMPDPRQTKIERTMSDSNLPEENKSKNNSNQRKTSLGIPRIRVPTKQTNLLDTPHWAILPPPSKFTKDTPDEAGKGSLFVPTGTIIDEDSDAANGSATKSASLKVEKVEKASPRDSNSDSSSSERDHTENQMERPKSLTMENLESASSGSLSKNSSQSSVGISQDSVDGGKMGAPLPPPRTKSGHSRSSSLDLQRLFNNKGASTSLQENDYNEKNRSLPPKSGIQNDITDSSENKDTSQNGSQENFADFSKFENSLTPPSNENLSRHRRSVSLDSTHAIWVEASPPAPTKNDQVKEVPSNRQEMSTSLPRPVPKKKPASPPPSLRQKKETLQDSGSDGIGEKEKKISKEPIHFVVKPLTRLEQLHAKIRDLKTKNTRLSRVNNELQQELKQMMERRIGLESSLDQLKPFAK